MSVQEILTIIPDLSEVDMAFPAGPNISGPYDKLIPLAKEYEHTWGKEFFSKVFFGGGVVPPRKDIEELGITEEDAVRALRWLKAAMGSYYPSHQDKERVCGMLWETFFLEPSENAA